MTQNHILLKQDVKQHDKIHYCLQYDTDGESELLHMTAWSVHCTIPGAPFTEVVTCIEPTGFMLALVRNLATRTRTSLFSPSGIKKMLLCPHLISELLTYTQFFISATLGKPRVSNESPGPGS